MRAQCGKLPAKLGLSVTPVIYVMAMITFLGWFFFVLFGGIGLAALPLDLFADYANRPVRIDLEEFAKQKMVLNERSVKLLEIGRKFTAEGRHQKRTRQNKRTYNKFKQAVYFLDKDWEKVRRGASRRRRQGARLRARALAAGGLRRERGQSAAMLYRRGPTPVWQAASGALLCSSLTPRAASGPPRAPRSAPARFPPRSRWPTSSAAATLCCRSCS